MTTKTDIVNRALQNIGSRTTVTDAELATNSTNEAIQANIIYDNCRDDTSRMAPWNCTLNTAQLAYITSLPGTPENMSSPIAAWAKGLPTPPWLYEYQFPPDCLRMISIIPQQVVGGPMPPITPQPTGLSPFYYNGPPVKFKVAIDQFLMAVGATVVAGGSGYVPGEIITLSRGPVTAPPIGAPAQLLVMTIGGGGAVATVMPFPLLSGDPPLASGSYLRAPVNPAAQASSTGSGTGATFNLTMDQFYDQRVVLTNQAQAIGTYTKRVDDPNVFDTLFQSAFIDALAAQLCMALTGDKGLANQMFQLSNRSIEEARKVDGNEGLTINDFPPDWIRTRGINWYDQQPGGFNGFDWGGLWPSL